jgi:hypothetical protein
MKLKQNRALFLTALTLLLSIPSSAFAAWPESPEADSPLSDPVILILTAIVAVSIVINICLLIWALRMRRQMRHDAQYFFNQPVYNEDAIHDYAKMETLVEFKELDSEILVRQQVAESETALSAQGLETGSEVDFFTQGLEAAPQVDYFAQAGNHLPVADPEDMSPKEQSPEVLLPEEQILEEHLAKLSDVVQSNVVQPDVIQLSGAPSVEDISLEERGEINFSTDQAAKPIQLGGEAATQAHYLVPQDEVVDEAINEAAGAQEPEEFTLEMIRQVLVDLEQVQETTDEPAKESAMPPGFEAPSAMTLEPTASERPLAAELIMPELTMPTPLLSETVAPAPASIAPAAPTVQERASATLTPMPSTPMPPVPIGLKFEAETADTNYYGRHF